jgi:predicted ester cyclase
MPETDLRDFYRRYIAAINARQFDVVAEIVADDVSINGVPHKRQDVLASLQGLADAVPDFVWNVQDLFVDGDRIAARLRDTGTPTKAFLGQEPTGASIDVMEFASYRVRDGRFTEMWFLMDAAKAAEQLRRASVDGGRGLTR